MSKDSLAKLITVVALLVTGCSGYQHVSSPVYVPWNKTKGDVKLALSHNHIQGGYAVSNHVSLFATGFAKEQGSKHSSGWLTKEGGGHENHSSSVEELNFGASYFNATDRLVWEITAGGGSGSFHYYHAKDITPPYTFELSGSRSNFFVSPSFSFTSKPEQRSFVEIGGFTKIAIYRYSDLKAESTFDADDPEVHRYDRYFMSENARSFLFIEPGFCMRAGSKHVKGNFLLSVPINSEGDVIRHKKLDLYMSLFIDFNVFAKKTRRSE